MGSDCLDKHILQFRQIHLVIWINTFAILNKYILQFGQKKCNLDKCISQFGQINFQFGQIPKEMHAKTCRLSGQAMSGSMFIWTVKLLFLRQSKLCSDNQKARNAQLHTIVRSNIFAFLNKHTTMWYLSPYIHLTHWSSWKYIIHCTW